MVSGAHEFDGERREDGADTSEARRHAETHDARVGRVELGGVDVEHVEEGCDGELASSSHSEDDCCQVCNGKNASRSEHALVQDSGHCELQEWEVMCYIVMRTLRDER